MKSPWPTKKLGEICEIRMGETLIEKDLTGEGIPVYSADSLEVPWGFTSNNRLRFYKGSIIIGARGTIGSVKLPTDEIFTATQTTIVLTPKIKEMTSTFLYYFLRKINFKSIQGGTGIPMLTVGTLSSFEIPLPPLSVQQKIVKILDTIQEAVEIQEKIIEKTKELKKSLMNLLFHYGLAGLRVKELASSRVGELTSSEIEKLGLKLKKTEIGEIPEDWEVVRIKDVVLDTEQNDPSKIPLQEIKYIDVSSISNEFLKIIEYKTYLGKDAPSRARKILKENDVIFATVRPYLRRIAFITGEYNGFYGSTAFCVLRPNVKKIFPYFLFYYVSTDKFVYKVSGYQTGSGYPAITDDHIKNERIPLPPLPEQQEIAEILQTIDQKIEIEKKKKELYEELFKTMLNKIMNQEIDVNLLDY